MEKLSKEIEKLKEECSRLKKDHAHILKKLEEKESPWHH